MRRRVLQATIAAVTAAVVLLGVPLAIFGFTLVRDADVRSLDERAAGVLQTVDRRIELGLDLTSAHLVQYLTQDSGPKILAITVVLDDGRRMSAGDRGNGVLQTRTRTSGTTDTQAVVYASRPDLQWRAWRVVLLVAAAAAVAVAGGMVIAGWSARRLASPLVYLAASAEQLGSGQVRVSMRPSGVEEIDLVASELQRSAERLAAQMASERQFAADASHQLRTPLTALYMRLEEITMYSEQEDIAEEASIALTQVERLQAVVDDLLVRSRKPQGGSTEPVLLADLVSQQVAEWKPNYKKAKRKLVTAIPSDLYILATPGGLSQVLATLIENSLQHGGGTTTVRTRSSPSSTAVAIEVSDEGPGVPDDLAPFIFEREVSSVGSGLGLAMARDLVAAFGGRLDLAQRKPAVFIIYLTAAPKGITHPQTPPSGYSIPASDELGTQARKLFGRP